MTLENLKAELAAMPEEQQNHLAAFLVHLRHLREPGFPSDTARRIDAGADQWVSLDQLKEHWKARE